MAEPADISVRNTAAPNSLLAAVHAQQNKIIDVLRIFAAKADADAGVTDTNYAALVTAADAASPAKISVI